MVRSYPQYTEHEVSMDSEVVCLWFTKSCVYTAELSLELKPQANDIKIRPNLICGVISYPIDRKWSFNGFRGGFPMIH
jgi:hypothetical protein